MVGTTAPSPLGEKAGMRGCKSKSILEGVDNRLQHIPLLIKDLVIPKADHPKPETV
jgi:hypothetical protein